MNPVNAKRLVKILRENGFILSRQKGSHQIWKNLKTGIIVPIPFHGGNKPIPMGTLLSIIKQSKISKENFK